MSDYSRLILGEDDSQTAPVCNGTVREMIADIDRLKWELEEVTKIREYLEIHTCLTHNLYLVGQTTCPACELERQLDASQALLAEAEYQIEKQTIETRSATQLASDYIKQLAEAKESEAVDAARIHLFDEEVEDLRKQLAEARAEVERLKVIKWVQTESYEAVAAVEQARQEVAREILDNLRAATFWVDGPDTDVVRIGFIAEYINNTFKLGGVRDEETNNNHKGCTVPAYAQPFKAITS